MKIDFKKLQEIGAFVRRPLLKEKTINWTLTKEDGTTEDFEGVVYIRRNSCATFERYQGAHGRAGSKRRPRSARTSATRTAIRS